MDYQGWRIPRFCIPFWLLFSISPGSFLMTHGVLVTGVPVIPSFFCQLYGSHRNHGSPPQHSLYQHHGNQRDSHPAELQEGSLFFVFFKHGRCSVSCINGMLLVSWRFLFFWGGACWCFHFKDLKIVNLPLFRSLWVASLPAQWSNGPVSIGNLQTLDSPLLDYLKATVI